MKLAWLTDIHLNFINSEIRIKFYDEIRDSDCDALLISGDIAEAPCISDLLVEMVSRIQKPTYFILGNHDYYRGNVHEVRHEMTSLTGSDSLLFWLPATGKQQLTQTTVLIGQDGWADGRLGKYDNSYVELNDSRMIAELFQEKIQGKLQLVKKMQELADTDAVALKENLIEAMQDTPKKIIILTHVPPFKEACLHEGKISDDNWLPFFSSKVMGDVIEAFAKDNSSVEFLVLSGHTHSEAYYQPFDNLTVKVGSAEYYYPEVQEIIIA